MPDKNALADLKVILAEHPAQVMLWEGEPVAGSVKLLKDMGISSDVFDPCGNRPGKGDFMTVMEANVATMEALAK
jgi:zinc transport system substrate-binding protein